MSYKDRTRVRTHTVKVRFSDEESQLVEALAVYTGEQLAALLRDLILERASEILPIGRGAYEAA